MATAPYGRETLALDQVGTLASRGFDMKPETWTWSNSDRALEGKWLEIRPGRGPSRLDLAQPILYPRNGVDRLTRDEVSFHIDYNGLDLCVIMHSPRLDHGKPDAMKVEGRGRVLLFRSDSTLNGNCSLVRVRSYNPYERTGEIQFYLQPEFSSPRTWEILSLDGGVLNKGKGTTVLLFDSREQSLTGGRLYLFTPTGRKGVKTLGDGVLREMDHCANVTVQVIKGGGISRLGTLREIR